MTIITDEVLTNSNGARGVYVKLVNNDTAAVYAATGPTSSVGVWTATAPPGTYSEYTSLTGTGSPPGSGWTLFNSNYIVTDPVALADVPLVTRGLSPVKQGVVIGLGAGGAFDEAIVESPSVWWDSSQQQYGMVYTAYTNASPQIGSVGLAWSPDLFTWSKDSRSPIFQRTGAGWESGGITGPVIWYEGGTYYLFYIGLSATGYEGGNKQMGLATSTDLVTWTRYAGNPIIGPSSAGTGWRSSQVWHPSIVKVAATYYMFLNATGTVGAVSAERIGYATSTDLQSWTVDDTNSPLIPVGAAGAWDSLNAGDPSVYKVGSQWYMAYYGFDGTFASDGVAFTTEAAFPLGWTKHPLNPLLVPGPAAYDNQYAHKPYAFQRGNDHYHFYTAVGTPGRQIALAVDRPPASKLSVQAAAIATPASDTSGTKAVIDAIRVVLQNAGLTAITPPPSPGLVGWWKADSLAAQLDGSTVAAWADSSGTGNAVAQATSTAQPIYKANVRNGLPAVRFATGTGAGVQYLHKASSVSVSTATLSLLVVAKRAWNVNMHPVFIGPNAATNSGLEWYLDSGNSYKQQLDKSGVVGVGTSSTGFSFNAWHTFGLTWDGTNLHWYLDGVTDGTASGAQAFTGTDIYLGGWGAAGWEGDIGEILLYNGVLSAANLAGAQEYLKSRWGL